MRAGGVGLYPASGGFDNTTAALRAALKEKASKYGRPQSPFVLAPLVTSGHLDTEDVVDALFGTEAVQVSGEDLEQVRVIRRRDGFWIAGDGFRGTRISAVLIGDAILPWTAAKAVPRLWLNPGWRGPCLCTSSFRQQAWMPMASWCWRPTDSAAPSCSGFKQIGRDRKGRSRPDRRRANRVRRCSPTHYAVPIAVALWDAAWR